MYSSLVDLFPKVLTTIRSVPLFKNYLHECQYKGRGSNGSLYHPRVICE